MNKHVVRGKLPDRTSCGDSWDGVGFLSASRKFVIKMWRNILRWLVDILRTNETETVKNSLINSMVKNVDAKWNKGREKRKKRWIEFLESDQKMTKICKKDAKDRNKWKGSTKVADPK